MPDGCLRTGVETRNAGKMRRRKFAGKMFRGEQEDFLSEPPIDCPQVSADMEFYGGCSSQAVPGDADDVSEKNLASSPV
jgi:hypothetical protein